MAHGFVLGELVFAIGSMSLIWAAVEMAEPSLERVCVGRASKPNDAESATVVTDVRRWLCAPLSIEPPEFRFARARSGERRR